VRGPWDPDIESEYLPEPPLTLKDAALGLAVFLLLGVVFWVVANYPNESGEKQAGFLSWDSPSRQSQ
jgi:hypothetical protein